MKVKCWGFPCGRTPTGVLGDVWFGDAFPYPFGIDAYSSLVYDARTTPYTSSYYCVSYELKGKERKSIYIAPFCTKVHTKRSGIDHTVLPANNTMPAFPSWRSPDVTTTATEAADIQLQFTTHLSTPKG